jgi:hypothetical protein
MKGLEIAGATPQLMTYALLCCAMVAWYALAAYGVSMYHLPPIREQKGFHSLSWSGFTVLKAQRIAKCLKSTTIPAFKANATGKQQE